MFCEWMEGGSLQDRIGDGSLYEGDPLQVQLRIISIAMQAAEGLRFAHGRGIVHCDVRPSGIMFDSDGTVRVSDFDLAERIGKRSAGPNREKSEETNDSTWDLSGTLTMHSTTTTETSPRTTLATSSRLPEAVQATSEPCSNACSPTRFFAILWL